MCVLRLYIATLINNTSTLFYKGYLCYTLIRITYHSIVESFIKFPSNTIVNLSIRGLMFTWFYVMRLY